MTMLTLVRAVPVPWIGLAAIAAMFLLSWATARGYLDGPRQIHHRPRRHVCADCAEPWTPDHQCHGWLEAATREPVVPLSRPEPPPHVQLDRLDPRQLARRYPQPALPSPSLEPERRTR
jgi:hypothetical protein